MQLLRIMKKMIIGSIIMLAAFSCDKYEYDDSAIWDKLEEIERHRDETVHSGYETLCNRLNANISSIHTILQAKTEGEYVTNVISMMDNGKDVGYLVNFPVTGSVPVFLDLEADMLQIPDLGLKQDKDGTHYWTLYSACLLDNDGNKVSDPPLLDVGSGYWHLSLDDGMTWEQLESIGSDSETSSGTFLFEDYNPLFWEDSDFEPGTVVFMGKKSAKAEYKGITHVTLYIGGGYIIHSQAPRGLLGGEGIMIDKLRDMELRYDRPFCSAASPKYHTNYDEERSLQ